MPLANGPREPRRGARGLGGRHGPVGRRRTGRGGDRPHGSQAGAARRLPEDGRRCRGATALPDRLACRGGTDAERAAACGRVVVGDRKKRRRGALRRTSAPGGRRSAEARLRRLGERTAPPFPASFRSGTGTSPPALPKKPWRPWPRRRRRCGGWSSSRACCVAPRPRRRRSGGSPGEPWLLPKLSPAKLKPRILIRGRWPPRCFGGWVAAGARSNRTGRLPWWTWEGAPTARVGRRRSYVR